MWIVFSQKIPNSPAKTSHGHSDQTENKEEDVQSWPAKIALFKTGFFAIDIIFLAFSDVIFHSFAQQLACQNICQLFFPDFILFLKLQTF